MELGWDVPNVHHGFGLDSYVRETAQEGVAVGYPRPVAHASERHAPVAQRIEHLTTDQKVWGSNPYRRTEGESP